MSITRHIVNERRLAQAEKLLKALEWTGEMSMAGVTFRSRCPDCANEEWQGHTEHCELARFLGTDPETLGEQEEVAG